MPVQGRPRCDTLALGELSASFFGEPKLQGKAAYTDSRTGQTHGFTTATAGMPWSKDTMECLQRLRDAMELDFVARDFESASTVPSFESQLSLGLGEHLASDDPHQL